LLRGSEVTHPSTRGEEDVADFNTNVVTLNTEIEKRLSNPILLLPLSRTTDFCDLRSVLNYAVTIMMSANGTVYLFEMHPSFTNKLSSWTYRDYTHFFTPLRNEIELT